MVKHMIYGEDVIKNSYMTRHQKIKEATYVINSISFVASE